MKKQNDIEYIEVAGSELNSYNIFDEKSFHRFIPEGYMIKEIIFQQEEEFNNSHHWGESCFFIYIKKIGI